MNINDVCDYIILQVSEPEKYLNNLKLHKLLYYVQAWHLAFYDEILFDGKFQAWIHGPVNREIYDRFKETKSLYSDVDQNDIRDSFDLDALSPDKTFHIDKILEAYAKFTGTQLEEMSHQEEPWNMARKGYRPTQRCEELIDENVMRSYYAGRLK